MGEHQEEGQSQEPTVYSIMRRINSRIGFHPSAYPYADTGLLHRVNVSDGIRFSFAGRECWYDIGTLAYDDRGIIAYDKNSVGTESFGSLCWTLASFIRSQEKNQGLRELAGGVVPVLFDFVMGATEEEKLRHPLRTFVRTVLQYPKSREEEVIDELRAMSPELVDLSLFECLKEKLGDPDIRAKMRVLEQYCPGISAVDGSNLDAVKEYKQRLEQLKKEWNDGISLEIRNLGDVISQFSFVNGGKLFSPLDVYQTGCDEGIHFLSELDAHEEVFASRQE